MLLIESQEWFLYFTLILNLTLDATKATVTTRLLIVKRL